MKNGHDKIDDVFRQPLGNTQSTLPDSFFEEAWEKYQQEIHVTRGSWLSSKWFFLISASVIITGIIATIAFSSSNEKQSGNRLSQESVMISNNKPGDLPLSEKSGDIQKTEKPASVAQMIPAEDKNNTTALPAKVNANDRTVIPENKRISADHINTESYVSGTDQLNHNLFDSETKAGSSISKNINIVPHRIRSIETGLSNEDYDISLDYNNPELTQHNKRIWSAGISSSLLWLNSRINAINPELKTFAASRNDAYLPGFSSVNAGVDISYHSGRYIISAGLNYNQFTENTDYGIFLYNPQQSYLYYYNGSPYTYIQNGQYYLSDTTTYWHYTYVVDSVLHISDSVLTSEITHQVVNAIDSTLATRFDTADYSKLKAKYSLIELPLYAGFEWNHGRWGYGLSAGIIPGMLIRQSGSLFGGEGEVLLPADILPVRKFLLNAGLKFHFSFYPSEKIMIYAGPEMKGNIINAAGKSSGLHQQWLAWGLKGGLRYFF
jgi:hypothetical protein